MPLLDDQPRSVVADLVAGVLPYDRQEASDQAEILRWVASGAPLFRVRPPATPPRHLAVYFALLDEGGRQVMLVDHIKAGCWLLPGGHVDDGEDPRATVVREAEEELGIAARFHEGLGGGLPFFLTVTQTRGAHSHTDVTVWFVLTADRDEAIRPDLGEFRGVSWFGLDEPIEWNTSTFDPQMHRFIAKLRTALVATGASTH
ncbi:NUDIX hydrolase [Frankia sp. Cr1]|uniref:NUDIX hydrolase n=1 Tax=Frankia sp. Cr1 TaxID=3073931 RepID=UPI002AD4321D|nr:NUDIX hydrolase [Frankia sp. Cr1]